MNVSEKIRFILSKILLEGQGYKNHIMYIDPLIDIKYRNFIMRNKFPDPKFNCQDESLRWAELLHNTFGNELDIEFCGGFFVWNGEFEGHYWLKLNGGIFDPTIGQFRDSLRGVSFENYEEDETKEYPLKSDRTEENDTKSKQQYTKEYLDQLNFHIEMKFKRYPESYTSANDFFYMRDYGGQNTWVLSYIPNTTLTKKEVSEIIEKKIEELKGS